MRTAVALRLPAVCSAGRKRVPWNRLYCVARAATRPRDTVATTCRARARRNIHFLVRAIGLGGRAARCAATPSHTHSACCTVGARACGQRQQRWTARQGKLPHAFEPLRRARARVHHNVRRHRSTASPQRNHSLNPRRMRSEKPLISARVRSTYRLAWTLHMFGTFPNHVRAWE